MVRQPRFVHLTLYSSSRTTASSGQRSELGAEITAISTVTVDPGLAAAQMKLQPSQLGEHETTVVKAPRAQKRERVSSSADSAKFGYDPRYPVSPDRQRRIRRAIDKALAGYKGKWGRRLEQRQIA
jgi:hypothetical protein